MSALFLVLLLMPAAAGVCAWLGCRMEEGILLSVLGLITAGYILVLSGGVPWLGLLPWVAAVAGGVLALRRFGKNVADWHALAQGMLLFFAFRCCIGGCAADAVSAIGTISPTGAGRLSGCSRRIQCTRRRIPVTLSSLIRLQQLSGR